MRRILVALTLTTLSTFVASASPALAASARVARGTVASFGGSSITVTVADRDMTFVVDAKTLVEVRGGSTTSAQAAASGKSGPKLADLLKAGQPVAVTYGDMAGPLHATSIKAIPKAVASTSDPDAAMTSSGVVKAAGADWLTINGRAGTGATFEQTFKIDQATKVFTKGAGTAAAAKGGKVPFASLVTSGDRVSVSYHTQGSALLASDVHVTMKATR